MRLLPQRHDHQHEGAAQPVPSPFRGRDHGSAALQSLPVRRAYRDFARGDAGGGSPRRGGKLMGAKDPADSSEIQSGSLSVVRPAGTGASGGFETFIKITADGSVTAYNGH